MIIIKFKGGLGNQLFQYALFIAFFNSSKNIKLDTSSYDNYPLHNGIELEKVFGFEINKYQASFEELENVKDLNIAFKIREKLGLLFYKNPNKFLKRSHFVGPNFSGFYPELFLKDEMYLDGYWQNIKYLNGIDKKIFKWRSISNQNLLLARKMQNEESVSIHIRKLEPAKNVKQFFMLLRIKLVWRTCSTRYYQKAIKHIQQKITNPNFYVFTDNLSWVQNNISLPENALVVNWNRDENSYQDMYLMSNCKHNIISMSSFSWWGAWLNANDSKIIIAPQKWAIRFVKTVDIIPENWIKL